MTFLTPIFLLGALAVGLPVVFHLIRRTTREHTVFSSLMFLLPTPPRLTRRSRLEHLLLLFLRCLALCLLALGFARPFIRKAFSEDRPSTSARRIMVLVDTSASMRRANLWAEARSRAESILRKASPADQVSLFTFDRVVQPLVTFEQWSATPAGERFTLAESRLASVSPGWAGTQIGNALMRAAEIVAEAGGKTADALGQVILISDLQEGGHLEPLQGYEWPRGLQLSVEVIKPSRANNASLQRVTASDEFDPGAGAGTRVRVSNAADSKRDQFEVGWCRPDGHSYFGKPIAAYVPPGQSRVVALPTPLPGDATDRIRLQGDDEDFDNTLYVTPQETNSSTIVYLGKDSGADAKQPLYFLRRAFRDTRRESVKVLAGAPAETTSPEAPTATLFILTDSLSEQSLKMVREQVTAGKTALLVLAAPTMAPTLAALLGLEQVAVEDARPNKYAMLAEINFSHPLFAPFADPRFSDFTKIHFWRYRRLDLAGIRDARVVAKFDTGDPAVIEVPIGHGHIMILASGWQPEDSQLAVSSKFVPMLYALLEESAGLAPVPPEYHVGDVVLLAPSTQPVSVRLPDGSVANLPAGETNFSRTTMPGVYTVTSAQPPKLFAVNLDAAESRTTPLAVEDLERLGAPISRQVPAVTQAAKLKTRLQDTEVEARQKLWRWFIAATLAVLLFETWLAGRTQRASMIPTPGAT
jgi:hypothetical protein